MSAPVNGRVPPGDLDAERAVLAACLLDGAALDEVADLLRPAHWYAPAHVLVWDAVLELHRNGSPVDVVLVAQALRAADKLDEIGGSKYLAELCDGTPATAHVRQHAEIVVGLSRLRAAIALCHARAAAGYVAASDVEGYLGELERDVMALGQQDARTDGVTLRESLRAVGAALARAESGQVVGLETGIGQLDALTGGLRPGDLVVVAGRPGMGKSALAGVLARRAAEICGVGWWSLEMPHEQITARLLAAEAGADLRRLRTGHLTESEGAALLDAAPRLERLPIVIDDCCSVTATDIRSRARRLASRMRREGHPLGLCVVDYLQLMRGEGGRGSSREENVAAMSRTLKALARDLGVPVIALSQLNRDVEKRQDRRPSLADLRESGAIEQDADAVWLLYRAGYYAEQRGESGSTETELIVAKNRNGPTGVVRMQWFGGSCTFAEAEQGGGYT